jgi:hypothetical protein
VVSGDGASGTHEFGPIRVSKFGIATCSYKAFTPDMGAPVRITRYPPRWKLGYTISHHIRVLAPSQQEWDLRDSEEAFSSAYLARMATIGPEEVVALVRTAVGNRCGVLLCFEDIWSADAPERACHRRLLAHWLEVHTRLRIPELAPRRAKS